MKTIRQNFILPLPVKHLLDKTVPKGKQSQFVSNAIHERLVEGRSWKVLNAEPTLDIPNPSAFAKDLRDSWPRSS